MEKVKATNLETPMVTSRLHRYAVVLSAIVFSFLFHRSYFGINVLLFEVLLIVATAVIYPNNSWTPMRILVTGGLLLTGAAYVLFRPGWTLLVNAVTLVAFVGVSMAPRARSLFTNMKLSLQNLPYGFIKYIDELRHVRRGGGGFAFRILRYYYMLVPVLVIVLFIIIYRYANPVFDEYIGQALTHVWQAIREFFRHIDLVWIFVFIIGFVLSAFALVHVLDKQMLHRDSVARDTLQRVRGRMERGVSRLGLKNEWRAAIFLLVSLNLLILSLNLADLHWVWFNFEWNGQYLKDFVREGTYLLILSIVISMAIVLYFFRRNLNFYSRNVWLKRLCYLWLGQNAFLAISVAVRNWRYIEHFALAYKRIGVFFFLLAVVAGIITVWIKVSGRKTAFYLFRMNVLSVYLTVLLSALIPWDSLIARYNFSHHDRAFLHFDFMSELSPSAYPYMDYSLMELRDMETAQDMLFPFKEEYMTADEYYRTVEREKQEFMTEFEAKNWQEWTMAEQKAYDYLKESAEP